MRVKIVSEKNLGNNNKKPMGIYDGTSINLINSSQKILMGSFALYDAINGTCRVYCNSESYSLLSQYKK